MGLDEDVVRLAKGKNLATVVTLMPDGQPQALLRGVQQLAGGADRQRSRR